MCSKTHWLHANEMNKLKEKRKDSVFSRLFKPRTQSVLGIDIGSRAVKLVELSRRDGVYEVCSYGAEPLPPHAVVDKRIEDEDAVGEAVERAVTRCGAQTRDAVAAVPGSAVIAKVLTVPSAPNDADMVGQIQLEAANRIPFPIEELHFDFEVLGVSGKAPDRVDVLLVASRNENVDVRAAVLERAGLRPKAVDVEPYALEHAFTLLESGVPDGGAGKTVAMVDIGATATLLTVLHDRKTVYAREQPFDGEPAAETTDQGQARTPVSESRMNAIRQRIDRALHYFFSTTGYAHVDHLILAGEQASTPGIGAFIQEKTAIPATVADPFGALAMDAPIPPAPAMTIASGLALRGFL